MQVPDRMTPGRAIDTLRRREGYLQEKVDAWQGSPQGMVFTVTELAAVRFAMEHLKLVEQDDATVMVTPLLALQGLVDALSGVDLTDRARRAQMRAQSVLDEWR